MVRQEDGTYIAAETKALPSETALKKLEEKKATDKSLPANAKTSKDELKDK